MVRIYEVMKVRRGLPVFYREHLLRLEQSIKQYKTYTYSQLDHITINLIENILPDTGGRNIKLIYNTDSDNFLIELIPNRAPDSDSYSTGVDVDIYDGERVDPLIKRENSAFRSITEERCKKSHLYDLLLRNRQGHITEGTRSNFLLISPKGEIITSPIGEALNGITRDRLFSICREENIPIIEAEITEELICNVHSMVITGTSPGVLPVKMCGNIELLVNNPITELLTKRYEESIENSLTEFKLLHSLS